MRKRPRAIFSSNLKNQTSNLRRPGYSFAEVLFSGLTPGLVGVWQINARVPANALSGAVPVRVVINGARSNGITVNIKP